MIILINFKIFILKIKKYIYNKFKSEYVNECLQKKVNMNMNISKKNEYV